MPCGQYMAGASLGRIFYVPNISKGSPNDQIWLQTFVRVIWKLTIKKQDRGKEYWWNWAIEVYIQQMGLALVWLINFHIYTNICTSWWYLHFSNLNCFIRHLGWFTIVGFTCGARSIPKDRSLNNIFLFWTFWESQTNRFKHALFTVQPSSETYCLSNNLSGVSWHHEPKIFQSLTAREWTVQCRRWTVTNIYYCWTV